MAAFHRAFWWRIGALTRPPVSPLSMTPAVAMSEFFVNFHQRPRRLGDPDTPTAPLPLTEFQTGCVWRRRPVSMRSQRKIGSASRPGSTQLLLSRGWASVVSRQAGTGSAEHWGLSFLNGRLTFILNSHEPGTHLCSAPGVAPLGDWMHVAGTYDGQTARAFINGVEVCSVARSVTLKADTTPVILGGNANSALDDAQELFKGLIDDVAIHNRALSTADLVLVTRGGACAVAPGDPEVITPGEILAEEEGFSGQAKVSFVASAVDPATSASLPPVCTPASGTSFALGTTAVNCTAAIGTRSGTATFILRVSPRNRGNRVAMFVVGNTTLSPSDIILRRQIEARGYDVVTRSGPVVTTADATGKALILISQSVTSADVNTKLTNVRVPVVVLEPALFDDLKLTGLVDTTDYGVLPNQTQLQIVKPHHPLAAGFSGALTVTSSPQGFVWGKPPATATKIATIAGNPDQSTLFAYATGDQMVGLEAPNRRVALFVGQDVSVGLNDAGKKLVDAAITWATQAEILFVVQSAATLSPADVALQDRLTGLGYGVFVKSAADVLAVHGESAALVFISGSAAPGGRLSGIHTPMVNGASLPALPTPDGWKLIDAAVRSAAQPEVIFVVGKTTLDAADAAVDARLKALGFRVLIRTGSAVSSADVTKKSAVVVSGSVLSADVNTKVRDSATPVLTLEDALLDDLQMCGPSSGIDYGVSLGQTQLTIVDATHPLAAGFSGTATVVSSPKTFIWGKPSINATKVAATVGFPDRAAIFAYRAGVTMMPLESPARRVGWFSVEGTAAALTADGQKMLDAAVRWLVSW